MQKDTRSHLKEYLPRVDRPLVEILGDHRVLIEHHKGVSIYEPTLMQVKVCFGYVEILGSDLNLLCMSMDKLVIAGRVESVRFLRGSK